MLVCRVERQNKMLKELLPPAHPSDLEASRRASQERDHLRELRAHELGNVATASGVV
jgi:hypothetical protein